MAARVAARTFAVVTTPTLMAAVLGLVAIDASDQGCPSRELAEVRAAIASYHSGEGAPYGGGPLPGRGGCAPAAPA
jgi:hypothetical protein